jgi:hypothetical protein
MFGLPLAFAAPAVLVTLVALAALYYFLRVTPPRPRQVVFPPLRLLLGLDEKETTPAKTPWPLLLLRLAIAAAVVLAMAGPIWNAAKIASGRAGALLVIFDDGWASAPTWDRRLAVAREAMSAATRAGRLAALAPTSQGGLDVTPLDAANFEAKLSALAPAPYAPRREAALAPIARFLASDPNAELLWIADGLELGGANGFASKLKALGHSVTVVADAATPIAIAGVESLPGALKSRLARADANARADGVARALDGQGRVIGQSPFQFGSGLIAEASFELPVELRNEIARVVVADEAAAGATWLIDERWRRRRVAIVSGASNDIAQPLLSPNYYVRRALAPYADIREVHGEVSDPVLSLLAEKPSALVLADMSVAPGPTRDKLNEFVDSGGVLIRFAGTRLAAGDDDLIPTALRRGGRTLGGALSWETPKHIAPFEDPSPFVGLAAPEEVTVTRQVLAEPEPGLVAKTWARLADGTPLVTAERRGKGLIVLFHVTADTTWSNLPISGLFVEMLRRIVAEAGAAPPSAPGFTAKSAASLPPFRTLDGFGTLGLPPANAEPIPDGFAGTGAATHPPGFYGAADSLVAVNAMASGDSLAPADYAGLPMRAGGLATSPPIDLKPWLLLAALLGFLVDALASLWLARPQSFVRRPATLLIAVALFAGMGGVDRGHAQTTTAALDQDMKAALETHLGYVATGDADVDETSRLGLSTLAKVLDRRTSAAVAEPVALDPARDELAFYPLIYWPIVAGRPQPPSLAVARITAYMKNGGTVIFDTRDALNSRPGGSATPETLWLRTLLAGVDVPLLEQVPRDHVVTKTFYLLDSFVGRTDMGQTWIEALPPPDPNDRAPRPARAGDSVSPIIVTSNDLAGGWALDADGSPLHPLVPGGPRQREMAWRGGVNLVMYALTGNYKADQVHAKDLLERLSH